MRFSHLVLVVIRPLYMQAELQVSMERLQAACVTAGDICIPWQNAWFQSCLFYS